MSYVYANPGVVGSETKLTLKKVSEASDTGLVVPAMQDVTVNNANDVFTWTTLSSGSKFQVATTSTNDISFNIVVDQDAFFGTGLDSTNYADEDGIFGLSKDKVKVSFDLYMGDNDDATTGKTISGEGYVTGLNPTVSADSPVWVSPVTLSVTGDYTVSTSAQS